jgi:hypothetical protein
MEEAKRTQLLTFNVRQQTIPAITEEQYRALLADKEVMLSEETAKYLREHGYIVKNPESPSTPLGKETKAQTKKGA